MRNTPKTIYLQAGEDLEAHDFNGLHRDSVTWCEDKIYSNDIEYVSKDFLLSFLISRQKEIKEQKEKTNTSTMKGSQGIHRLRGIEKELKLIIEFIENGAPQV